MTYILKAPKGEEVKRLRLACNITQKQAAELCGFSSGLRISEIENGIQKMPPTKWTLLTLAAGMHPQFKLIERTAQPSQPQ